MSQAHGVQSLEFTNAQVMSWTLRAFFAAVCVSLAAPLSATSFAVLAAAGDAGRHERLAKAAKDEGSVTFYTSIPEKDMAVLAADFEKRYGVKVQVWRASTLKVVQRILAESRTGRSNFDAVASERSAAVCGFRSVSGGAAGIREDVSCASKHPASVKSRDTLEGVSS